MVHSFQDLLDIWALIEWALQVDRTYAMKACMDYPKNMWVGCYNNEG
jgi:hypothetical protein